MQKVYFMGTEKSSGRQHVIIPFSILFVFSVSRSLAVLALTLMEH